SRTRAMRRLRNFSSSSGKSENKSGQSLKTNSSMMQKNSNLKSKLEFWKWTKSRHKKMVHSKCVFWDRFQFIVILWRQPDYMCLDGVFRLHRIHRIHWIHVCCRYQPGV